MPAEGDTSPKKNECVNVRRWLQNGTPEISIIDKNSLITWIQIPSRKEIS